MLDAGGNKFGEDGILMILEELQHNNSLINLSFESSGLSVKGKEQTENQNCIICNSVNFVVYVNYVIVYKHSI